jgi:CBS domain-containing protein
MTPDVVTCFDDQDVREAAGLMEEHHVRRLVVLSRDRRLVGLLSLDDLAVEPGGERLAGEALAQTAGGGLSKP